MAEDWYRAEIVFRGTDELVEKLQGAIAGQDIVEIGSLEVARCNALLPADEPTETHHGPRVFGD